MQYINRYQILNVENNRSKQAQQLIIHLYTVIANKHEFQPILDILESIGGKDIQIMVAEIFPYFTHDKLADHGKESLWFL